MDNKYKEIENFINSQSGSFYLYVKHFLLDNESWTLLNNLANQTNVYVFSGVIRNFFLGIFETRDLDIVLENIDTLSIPLKYIRNKRITKNSFGGYKFSTGHLNIDVWELGNTWGIKEENIPPTEASLISTAFFNFSAIVYNFKEQRFSFGEDFILFLKYNAIDIVYEKNPNIPLCIINTMYYIDKYNLNIGKKLCNWIARNYSAQFNYYETQKKHFDKIIFNSKQINNFYLCCLEVSLLDT